jgi:hypothetical protein
MKRKTLFVLPFANDPITSSYVSYEMSSFLQPLMKDGAWVMPVPGWTLSDLTTQCANDSAGTVIGALILYDIENDTGAFNFIVEQNAYTHLYARAMLVSCEPYRAADELSSSLSSISKLSVGGTNIMVTKATPPSQPKSQDDQLVRTENIVTTVSVLPKLDVVWQNTESLDADGHEGSVPFIGLAGLGAYLASRTIAKTTSNAVMTPVTKNGVPDGSTTSTTSTMGNSSTLPYGLAIAGTTFGQLGGVSFGGTNGNRILKSAASRLASLLGRQWFDSCDPITTNGFWDNACGR